MLWVVVRSERKEWISLRQAGGRTEWLIVMTGWLMLSKAAVKFVEMVFMMAEWLMLSKAAVKSVEIVTAALEGGRFWMKDVIVDNAWEVVVRALKPYW